MPAWTEILKNNFKKWDLLCDYLELDEENRRKVLKQSTFPLNLPLRLAHKIAKNSLADPIFRQFVPLIEEEVRSLHFIKDPIQEETFLETKKLLHKYPSRALLIATSACAMHCRFCFRRHFDYEVTEKHFTKELEWLASNEEIEEVILSGGDPLSLQNSSLAMLFQEIGTLSHVKRIRIHTRFPIGIPERIDQGLLDILEKSAQQIWMVIHCNHVKELDQDIFSSLKDVHTTGATVLNQAVLLRGINDSIEAQEELSLELINHGIVPYYLHQLDRVEGASHFEVDELTGLHIIEALQEKISGYGVPKYVREVPGKACKTALSRPPTP